MSHRIYLSPPHLCGKEHDYVLTALQSNYIAPIGPMVDEFEQEFAQTCGFSHCAAVSSGTAALHLALRVLGVGNGDIVLASSLTFIGSVSPITYLGATPVFVDSDTTSWNMDPERLAEAVKTLVTQGTTPAACIVTDLYGQCADYDSLRAVLAPYDIPLVIDAAESLGASYKDRLAGQGDRGDQGDQGEQAREPSLSSKYRQGDCLTTFSFNGNKIITSSGGGMLASDNERYIEKARWLAQQAREPYPHYEHKEIGYNYRMSNIVAAVGRAQLEVLAERVRRKREIFAAYRQALHDLPVTFMPEAPYGTCSRWLTVMLIAPDADCTPEDIRITLENQNIESRPVWKPMHMQPVFRNTITFGAKVSEDLFARGLCLPSGTGMRDEDIQRICDSIRRCFVTV